MLFWYTPKKWTKSQMNHYIGVVAASLVKGDQFEPWFTIVLKLFEIQIHTFFGLEFVGQNLKFTVLTWLKVSLEMLLLVSCVEFLTEFLKFFYQGTWIQRPWSRRTHGSRQHARWARRGQKLWPTGTRERPREGRCYEWIWTHEVQLWIHSSWVTCSRMPVKVVKYNNRRRYMRLFLCLYRGMGRMRPYPDMRGHHGRGWLVRPPPPPLPPPFPPPLPPPIPPMHLRGPFPQRPR